MYIWDRDLHQQMQRKARWTFTEEVQYVPPPKKIPLFTNPSRYIPIRVFLARNGATFRSSKGLFIIQLSSKKISSHLQRQETSRLIQPLHCRHRVELLGHCQMYRRKALLQDKDTALPYREQKNAQVGAESLSGKTMTMATWITL